MPGLTAVQTFSTRFRCWKQLSGFFKAIKAMVVNNIRYMNNFVGNPIKALIQVLTFLGWNRVFLILHWVTHLNVRWIIVLCRFFFVGISPRTAFIRRKNTDKNLSELLLLCSYRLLIFIVAGTGAPFDHQFSYH